MAPKKPTLHGRLQTQLRGLQADLGHLSTRAREVSARAHSTLERQLGKLDGQRDQAQRKLEVVRMKLTGVRHVGGKTWQAMSRGIEGARTSMIGALRSAGSPVKRRIDRVFTRLPFYPVDVPSRPAPSREDPTISEKVDKMRAWMSEHGISDEHKPGKLPGVRKAPKAAAKPQPTPTASTWVEGEDSRNLPH